MADNRKISTIENVKRLSVRTAFLRLRIFAEFSVDYTTNDDGTYTCRGNNFKHKIEVSGVDGEAQVTFIVLTNDTEISYEEVFYSMIKAEISTGVPEFVILGWYY